MLTNTDGIQVEKVAALRPDLIIGLYSGLTKQEYDTLSKLAPVVAQPKSQVDYGVSWQEVTTTVGAAVGRKAQAEKVVAEAEAKIAAVRTANPKFNGATGLMATTYEGYYVYGPEDSRGRFLTDLGFNTTPTRRRSRPTRCTRSSRSRPRVATSTWRTRN